MKQMQEEVDKRKKMRHKLEKPDIPEEELLRQQNLLFAEARKQQELIDNAEDWSRMQQEAQLALQRQYSNSNTGTSSLLISNNVIQGANFLKENEFSQQNNNDNNLSNSKVFSENVNKICKTDDDDNYD